MIKRADSVATELTVILGWAEELKHKAPRSP